MISSHWSSAVRYSANQLDITNHGILMRYGFMLPEKQDTQLAYGLAFATAGCVSIVKLFYCQEVGNNNNNNVMSQLKNQFC